MKSRNLEMRLKYNDESLLTFLNSAMNIEFVYLILLGVNNFMEIDSSSGDLHQIIKFKDIKFKDINSWNVAQDEQKR
jgi:hypothetical protein